MTRALVAMVVLCTGADGVNANFEFSGCEDYDECAGEGTGHECDSVNGAVYVKKAIFSAVCVSQEGKFSEDWFVS